jgi:hypothetical protein
LGAWTRFISVDLESGGSKFTKYVR